MKPHGPRVLVKPDAQPEASDSGLVLPQDRHHVPTSGTVVALGDGSRRLQQVRTMVIEKCLRLVRDPEGQAALRTYRDECRDTYHTVSEGDRVVFAVESGLNVERDGESYVLLHEDEIVIVDKEPEVEGVPA